MSYRIVLSWKLWPGVKRVFAESLWLFLGLALAGVVFLVSFYTAMRVEMHSTQVEVPQLSGLTLAEAKARVDPLALVLEVVDQRNDSRVPSGGVLEQTPRAGDSVRRGRKVKLILSLGGRVLEVPDLVGQAARAISITLAQEGFVPGDEAHVASALIPRGKVMAQVPPPRATAVPNSRVHRLVSDGPPVALWVMPDLTGLTRAQAARWIEASGFRSGQVREVAADGRSRGVVVAQLPLAGYPIRDRAIVELAIAE
jgi:beta-lactam-binding protein with PASTA domain